MENSQKKDARRFISVRLSEKEYEEVYKCCNNAACRSLTEYVKKVLTQKPVVVKVRDQTRDELLETMISIKDRLDRLTEHVHEYNQHSLLHEITETRLLIRKIFEKWCQ